MVAFICIQVARAKQDRKRAKTNRRPKRAVFRRLPACAIIKGRQGQRNRLQLQRDIGRHRNHAEDRHPYRQPV